MSVVSHLLNSIPTRKRRLFVLLLFVAWLSLYHGGWVAAETFHATKNIKTIKLSTWYNTRMKRDTNRIAAVRIKLRQLAGKNGVGKVRAVLLKQMRKCREEIAAIKLKRMPHFHSLDHFWMVATAQVGISGMAYHLRPGTIGYIHDDFSIVQVLSPTSALCRLGVDSNPRRLIRLDGVDFSEVTEKHYDAFHGLCECGMPVTYPTITGSNTVPEVYAIKLIDDRNKSAAK